MAWEYEENDGLGALPQTENNGDKDEEDEGWSEGSKVEWRKGGNMATCVCLASGFSTVDALTPRIEDPRRSLPSST
eukprot:9499875-Pyramimonas_sp.AAC.1